MLEDVYKSVRKQADVVNWKKYNQNELFYEYIKHENDSLRENFYAGILCRFWGYSGKIYQQCNGHLPFEQCYDIVIDAINYVLKNRVWENPESSLYQDPSGPDKAFHIALKRQRGIILSNLTAQKRQANFNTLSIDEMYENYSDSTEGLFNMVDIKDEKSALEDINQDLVNMISSMKPTQTLILDAVCFNNWQTLNSIVNSMKKLTPDNYDYYKEVYNMSREDYFEAVSEFYSSSNKKILMEVKKTLNQVKEKYI